MKAIKNWSFFIIFILTGVLYLSLVDGWKVYGEMFGDIKEYFVGLPEDVEPELEQLGQLGELIGHMLEDLPQQMPKPYTITKEIVSGNTVWVSGNTYVIFKTASGNQVINPDGHIGSELPEGVREEDLRENVILTEEVQVIGPTGAEVPVNSGQTAQQEVSQGTEGQAGSETVQEPEDMQGPVWGTVDETYFADAVFIGDSRTVGLASYSALKDVSTFYASTGLSVYSVFSSKCIELPGQKSKVTIEDALAQAQFKKVYIMLGINELGTGNVRTFVTKYRTVLEHIMELQPDATIYVQSIMKVSEIRSNKGDAITNETIDARNEGLMQMAEEMGVQYLDINPAICDENGAMCSDYTHDGVHMKAQYTNLWVDYLKEHALLP